MPFRAALRKRKGRLAVVVVICAVLILRSLFLPWLKSTFESVKYSEDGWADAGDAQLKGVFTLLTYSFLVVGIGGLVRIVNPRAPGGPLVQPSPLLLSLWHHSP